MKIIGHRGARGLAPENTLAAIEAGIKAGVDEIEIDVRVTRDGVPVLHHDPVLRASNGKKIRGVRIGDHTLGQLRVHKPDLATLEESLKCIGRRRPVVIEVKPGIRTKPIIAAVNSFLEKGWRHGDFLFASFGQKTLEKLHQAFPRITCVVNERRFSIAAVYRAKRVGTTRIALNHYNVRRGLVRSMHRRGYKLSVYTLNNPQKARRWAKHGLYGVVTDYPDHFKDV